MFAIADVCSKTGVRKVATLTLAAAMTAATLQACSGGMAGEPGSASESAAATASTSAATAATAATTATSVRSTAKSITIPTPSTGLPDAAFSSFESPHVHPLDITPDGTKLLAVNTPNNDVEVFAISGNTLTLSSVIKVGLEPVSVRVYSNTQAWVVNKISNSVSIVDIKNNALIATLQTGAEPADVVFTGTAGSATNPARAYVSVAQAKELEVFDPLVPGATLQRIPILGQQPRALAVGPNGSGGTNVYVGIFESGNGTTAITGGKNDLPYEIDLARSPSGPYGGISPFPDNVNATLNKYTSLYAQPTTITPNVLDAYYTQTPPPVSVIVRRQAPTVSGALPTWLDENGKDWSIFINGSLAKQGSNADRASGWDLIDRDIAIVNTANNAVTYQGGVLNMVMALAVNPATNSVTAVGTDATNQIRYQPMLDGTFIQVLMGTYAPGGSTGAKADLNPHLLPYSPVTGTYSASSIPATCTAGSTLCSANSIGDPRGITWNPATGKGYVTSMGTNSVIVINSAGGRDSVLSTPIPVGQGPTGIVLNAAGANAGSPTLAYVLNKFDATISVLSLAATNVNQAEVERVALSYDPTPNDVRAGRPLLYNTQLFSGLGQISCASCHVDARTDRLAWDLGDPTGQPEVINSQPAVITGSSTGVTLRDMQTGGAIVPIGSVTEHPMKGPFLTMTLVDRMQSPFLHWRGDRANLAAFSPAFVDLQGGAAQPTTTQIANMQAFLTTLRTPPNPFRTITNQYPTEIAVPGPRNVPYRTGNAAAGAAEFEANCRSCHPGNTNRGYLFVNNADFGVNQLRNPPTWQNFYRRDGLWFSDPTASTAGFGFQPDGTFDSTQNLSRDDNMMSFMYSFNGSYPYTPTGLNATNTAVDSHAAVGRQVTLSALVASDPVLAQLQALADTNAIDLIASGCVNNETRGYVYVGNGTYADDRGQPNSLAAMKAFAQSGSPITFTGVRRGTGYILGIDQNDDGILDGAAGAAGTRVCSSGTQPNLLVNGSFETNSVQAGSWSNVANLAGWEGSDGFVQVWNGLYGYTALDGSSWIQLGATSTLDTVSQTVATTAGDSLVLTFWYSPRPGVAAAQNQFNVVWNGTVIDTLVPNGSALTTPSWQQASYVVKATGNDTLAFAQSGASIGGLGSLVDAVSLVDRGTSSATFASPQVNLAYGKSASGSEISYGTSAALAVDGNIDGVWEDGSVSITGGQNAQDYWEVDLGAVDTVQTVNLFNRTDCCTTRLNNFYVLVSQTSMDGQTLAQLLANPAVTQVYTANTGYVGGNSPQESSYNIGGVPGRYVRVQLAGTNQLQLAEVQVLGWPAGAK
jgi:YVTN family beta-propeller protein